MDKLQLCAKAFQKLLEYEYHFIIGRKGKLREFYLNFDKADFHHLSGLHKLKVTVQNPFGFNDQLLCKTENRKIFFRSDLLLLCG